MLQLEKGQKYNSEEIGWEQTEFEPPAHEAWGVFFTAVLLPLPSGFFYL